jgi:acetyltransferase
VDGVLVIYVPMDYAPSARLAEDLTDAAKNTWKPVIAAWMGGKGVQQGKNILVGNDIPVYETPEESVKTYLNMYRYKRNLDQLYETPHEMPEHEAVSKDHLKELLKTALREGRTLLTEEESNRFLAEYGIPVTPTGGPEASAEGTAIKKMVTGVDYELILRTKKHKDFGSVILFAMGGTAGEFIRDFSVGLPPLNQTLAKMLIQDSRAYKVLQGFDGKPAADFEKLEQILVNFSNLIVDFPDIAEIDINPLAIPNGIPSALKARVVVDKDYVAAGRSRYPHLVIAPYPTKYIMRWQLSDGTQVLLRPIRPEDEPAEREMLSTMSEETIRTRFFSSIRDITHDWLILLCNVDYDRHIAIIAETQENKKIIGVARLIINPDLASGELAVLVHDKFQRKGLGSKFVEVLVGIAREKGLEKVQAQFLVDNQNIRKVLKRSGFTTRWLVRDISEAELKLE